MRPRLSQFQVAGGGGSPSEGRSLLTPHRLMWTRGRSRAHPGTSSRGTGGQCLKPHHFKSVGESLVDVPTAGLCQHLVAAACSVAVVQGLCGAAGGSVNCSGASVPTCGLNRNRRSLFGLPVPPGVGLTYSWLLEPLCFLCSAAAKANVNCCII